MNGINLDCNICKRSFRPSFGSSNDYFPNLSWIDIQELFHDILINEIDIDLIPLFNDILKKKINFQFMNAVQHTQIKSSEYHNAIIEILKKGIKRYEIRRNIVSIINIFNYNVLEKYLNQAFEKRAYIAREVNFVERLKS